MIVSALECQTLSEFLEGGCHCKKITWRVQLPPTIALNCHCNMCRALSGADYSSWLVFPDEQFTLLGGEQQLVEYAATEEFIRRFCSACGATVTCVNNNKFPGHTYVAKGNVSSGFNLPPQIQVYIDDKAPWVTIDSSIPVFQP